ncbi:MAG: 50S ribosomal protein L21e [Nanoarchaeota archaeon]|nr:50S ribosomal protein L21e [Nanoarchaeota archaeon]
MKKTGGSRRKRRYVFRKHNKDRGKLSLSRYFQNFNVGDKVNLSVESAVQEGMYHSRFYGRVGVVSGKRGRCYEVSIKDGGKEKTLIVHPVHLKKG